MGNKLKLEDLGDENFLSCGNLKFDGSAIERVIAENKESYRVNNTSAKITGKQA
jgi:hypothetical protein